MRWLLFLPLVVVGCGGSTAAVAPAPAEASSPGALFSEGDALSYRIEDQAGRIIGRSHSTYRQREDRQEVVTRVGYATPFGAGEKPSWLKSWEYASTVRGDLSPVAFKRMSSVDGRLELVFRTGFVSIVGEAGTKEVPYRPDDAVILPPDDLVLLALVLKRQQLAPGSASALPVRVAETGQGERWPIQVYADAQRRTVAKLSFGTATLDGRGRVESFQRNDGTRFVLEATASEPPPLLAAQRSGAYERPAQASWTDREVVIEGDGHTLAATLSLPKLRNRKNDEGRLPAVVLFSDLPRGDRHGFTALYDRGTWQLLDRLADEGFIVLRFDPRGPEHGWEAAIADDRAVVNFLLKQAVVDPQRIHLLGHGYGALEALRVAQDVSVASVVTLAPAWRTSSLLAGRQSTPLEADYAKLDPNTLLKGLEEPVAVFQGLRDFEVPWRDNAQALVDAVNKQKRGQAKLHVYEYVDHLLKTQTGASTLETYADRGRKLDAQFLDELITWLSKG